MYPARRRHTTTNNPTPSTVGGLFSNVFTFVSREVESFVLNATGSQAKTDQGISSGRNRSSGRRMRNGDPRERNISDDGARHRSRRHHGCERRRRPKPDDSRPPPRSKSTDPIRNRPHRHIQPPNIDGEDEGR
ncbi:hypothetical protein BS17DRAFT_108136 [Gyrodon lividus]|nr:hypothetical protein BS17DRAFT_108136 [Gyrodon lividus]